MPDSLATTPEDEGRSRSLSARLAGSLRMLAAIFSLCVFFVGSLFLGLLVLPPIALFSLAARKRPYHFCRLFVHKGFALYLRMLEHLSLVRFRFSEFAEGPPEGAYVAVCNHPCLLDTPVMGAFLGPSTFTIRHTAARFSVSLASFLCGYLTIRAGSPLSADDFIVRACARIRRGEPIVMFPEGTRSSHETPGKFMRLPFDVAARAGVPLRVFSIHCVPRILTKERSVFNWPSVKIRYEITEVGRINIEPNAAAMRRARDEAHRLVSAELQSRALPAPSQSLPRARAL